MNWDAIGAVGELIGAVAVFVTLVYLAIQLRQNTKALKSVTFQNISTLMAQKCRADGNVANHPCFAAKNRIGFKLA